jgi:hypothetical protein
MLCPPASKKIDVARAFIPIELAIVLTRLYSLRLFCTLHSLNFIMTSVVGIDLGYQNSLIAAAGRGGVDVLLNGNSQRLNPYVVSLVFILIDSLNRSISQSHSEP